MKKLYSALTAIIFLLSFSYAIAQNPRAEVKPVTHVYAITGATVISSPGQSEEGATIIVRDGLIASIGLDLEVPYDAKVIEADSLYVYPGFIDGFSHTGIPRPKPDRNRERPKDPGNPTPEEAGIQPERMVPDLLKKEDGSISALRAQGFTLSRSAPWGRMLPGHTALLLLHDADQGEQVMRPATALAAKLQGGRGVYPATVIAVITKFRELYKQTAQHLEHLRMFEEDPTGINRPLHDPVMTAFSPVVKKEMPLVFQAEDHKTAYRVLELQQELGFALEMAGLKQSWHLTDELKQRGIPLYLSLDLPELESKKSGKDKKKEDAEESEPTPEQAAFEQRRKEELAKYYDQAAGLAEAGISFGFASLEAKPKDIRKTLRGLIEHGLSEEDALKALTTTPARMLGLSNTMGTLEAGKMANLIVSDGPFFEEGSALLYVMVEGKLYEVQAKSKKKGKVDEGMAARIAGTWSYSVEIPGDVLTGTLILTNANGQIGGEISHPMNGQMGAISDVNLEGKMLTFIRTVDIEGTVARVRYALTMGEDSFEGTADAGAMGTFPIEGTKETDPR